MPVAARTRPSQSPTEAMEGATGLRSNAKDLLRFLKANVGAAETELERAMRMAQEIRIERGRDDEDLGYGFSWRTQAVGRKPPILTHGGRTTGFTSLVAFDHERGIGTVVLANERAFNDRIGRELLFFSAPPPTVEARVDPALLRQYQGTYRDGARYRATLHHGRYFIRIEDGGYLTYQAHGRVRRRLYAESDSSFYMLRAPLTVTFHRQGADVSMVVGTDERDQHGMARSWIAWRVREETPPPAVVAGNAAFWRAWSVRTWALLGLLGILALAAVLRPVWSRAGQRTWKTA